MRGGNSVLYFTIVDRDYKRHCYRWNMDWKNVFFCLHLPPWISFYFFFLIRHANTSVPSRQRNCFTDCDSRVTWWQQSNFHVNNYPAVRVGSSFISIWWTRRIVLTKAASRAIVFRALGTDRGLTGLVHFSSILLPWPQYASTLKVGP